MSETETERHRDRATPPLAEFLDAFAEDDNEWWRLQGGDHLNLFEELLDERDAARAEVAALRTTLLAVRDLADEPGSGFPYVRQEAPRRVLAVAASVGSSGEAESGEALAMLECVEPGCFAGFAWHGTPQNARQQAARYGWTYYDGDHCPAHSPAPVSSGGREEAFVELLPPDVGHNLRHFGPETAHVTGAECHCHPEPIPHVVSSGGPADHRMLPGSHERGHGPECVCGAPWDWPAGRCGRGGQADADLAEHPVCNAAHCGCKACRMHLAARPVLSREAIRTKLGEHGIHGFNGHQVRCLNGSCGWLTQSDYLDHLADVLTAGGEQQ